MQKNQSVKNPVFAYKYPSWKQLKKWYTYQERLQFRTDLKATLCKGIKEEQVAYIKTNLRIQNFAFYLSRAYVPWAFYKLYRSGIFEQDYTPVQMVKCLRIMATVYAVYLAGSLFMRVRCQNIVNHYVPEEEKIDPIGDVLRGASIGKEKAL